ncbi:uncharacterized protein LOC131877775 [Tigriopus californicus]|uniref:uncharacterized protein LOC131877775 n=1 Tax=Tigriopus californicus TaxID=6832 RepID=UPI0027DA57B1|nr:uncharacterized protein LOC131877775 [Tigriopus californicus]
MENWWSSFWGGTPGPSSIMYSSAGSRGAARPEPIKASPGPPSARWGPGTRRSYSSPNPRGFVRLHSLEDDPMMMTSSSSTGQMPSPSQLDSGQPGAPFHAHQQTPQESKWLKKYPSDAPHRTAVRPSKAVLNPISNSRPVAKTPMGHQMPFNLNTGQYQRWHGQPQAGSEQLFQVGRPLIQPELANMFVPAHSWVAQDVGHCLNHLMGSMIETMTSIYPSPLNPNARPFVPLNPNAAEFRPTGSGSCGSGSATASETSSVVDSSEDHPSISQAGLLSPEMCPQKDKFTPTQSQAPSPCVTPVVDEQAKEDILKSVCNRKGTPWVPEPALSAANLSEESIGTHHIQDLKSWPASDLDGDSSFVMESDDNTTLSPNLIPNPRIHLLSQRSRSLSTCSSEESFIEFSCDAPNTVVPPSKSVIHANNDESDDDSSDSSDDEDELESEHDDDSDWDEVDDAHCWTDIPDEFKTCPFQCPIEARKSEEQNTPWSENEAVRDANRRWNLNYRQMSNHDRACQVGFKSETAWEVFLEDPEESEDLQAARKSDFPERAADKARMERMLSRIFQPDHRKKMFLLIRGEHLENI